MSVDVGEGRMSSLLFSCCVLVDDCLGLFVVAVQYPGLV